MRGEEGLSDPDQQSVDAFYWGHGPCCAGCDWWQHLNSHVGLCTRSAPIAGEDRVAMIGMDRVSMQIGGGHPFTQREHRCGDFQDDFDWSTLTPWYRRQIGCSAR